MSFSENLKLARERAHLTQRMLAAQSGVSQQAISAIESGGRSPSETTMKLLCDALGCTVSELIGDETPTSGEWNLTLDEKKLIQDYRNLNAQGQEYIRQTMFMALPIYKNITSITNMEDQKIG